MKRITNSAGFKYLAFVLMLLLAILPASCTSAVSPEILAGAENQLQNSEPAATLTPKSVLDALAPISAQSQMLASEQDIKAKPSQTVMPPSPEGVTQKEPNKPAPSPSPNSQPAYTTPAPSPIPAKASIPSTAPLRVSTPSPAKTLTPAPPPKPAPILAPVQLQASASGVNTTGITKTVSREPVSIGAIKQNPTAYNGQKVELSGVYRGWQAGQGSPPVTRSDWILQDTTGSIFVTGSSQGLKYPADVGKSISISSYVRLKNGQPYLDLSQPLKITVHFINVGQGDSILIDSGATEILIDGGKSSPGVVGYLSKYVDGPLEVMVATHPHQDHIEGLIAVLNTFNVQQIWHNGEIYDSATYRNFMNVVHAEGGQVYIGRRGNKINVGGLNFTLLSPTSLGTDTNNNSIVMSFSYGKIDFLFTGDAQSAAEAAMLAATDIPVPNIEILKVGHHGSRTASSAGFLAATTPETAIYMAGLNNSYGHPHIETINALAQIGANIYGTDVNGNITVTTDGDTYSVQTEK